MERLKSLFRCLLLLLAAAGLLCFPAECSQAARDALALCLQTVLPSLFPFFVLSSLVVSSEAAEALSRLLSGAMGPLFGVSGNGACALTLGLLGGYPVGARTAAELYRGGAVSRDEAERLLGFCNNSGPGFFLGICGGAVFHSARTGVYLYLIHTVSAVLTGILLRRRGPIPRDGRAEHAVQGMTSFPDAVRDSFLSVWSVCGFVVLFAVLLRLVTLLLPTGAADATWYPALLGFTELTNGVLALKPTRDGFVLCAVITSFGSLSVHAQTRSVTEEAGLSLRWHRRGKLLQSFLAGILALLLSPSLF